MTGKAHGWLLSIDFGTTATAGAMGAGGQAELVEIDNERRMPSMVCWREASNGTPGRLLLGDEAENEAALAPERVERSPKRKLGQDFMLLGSERIRVTEAVGQIFRHVIDEAIPRQGGDRPDEVRLTHPARWGEKRLAKLREAASFAGYDDPVLVPEPVGAAVYFAEKQLGAGDYVAVYDLGGGTFDTAVLRRTKDGFAVEGEPGGRDDLGGEDFDYLLYRFLGQQIDPDDWQTLTSPDSDTVWLRAHYDFKNDVRRAKESLSRRPEVKVRTPIPGTPDLQVRRSEFEDLIRDQVDITVQELARTMLKAVPSAGGISTIYLAGGSSQIPLVSRMIEERLGMKPRMLGDPKGVIALGAIGAHATSAATGTQTVTIAPSPARPTSPAPPTTSPAPPTTSPGLPTTSPASPTTSAGAQLTSPTRPTSPATPQTSPATPPPSPPPVISVPTQTPWAWLGKVAPAGRVAVCVTFLGALLLIISRFLPAVGPVSGSVWDLFPKRYSVILMLLALVAAGTVVTGLVSRRRRLLTLATLVSAYVLAAAFPSAISTYRFLGAGFWLGAAGGVLITVGAVIAVRAAAANHGEDVPTAAPSTVPSVVASVALLVLIGSVFLKYYDPGSVWSPDFASNYKVTMTVLAVLAIGLLALDRRNPRWGAVGVAAMIAAFLFGSAFPIFLPNYHGLKVGFWLTGVASLVAFVVIGGTVLMRAAGSAPGHVRQAT